jgi:hypothetical protein
MKSRCSRLLIVWFVGLLILAGCTTHRKVAQKTLVATPSPPFELLALPTEAQIPCSYQSAVALWELPGLEPVDPDSSSGGNTGERLGWVEACTEVRVTDYAWSEADQAFYVYVETESLKGWLALDFVDFVP